MRVTRPVRTLLAATACTAALAAGLSTFAAPTEAASGTATTTQLRPGALPRGADVRGPHLEAGQRHDTLVDGERRVAVPGRYSTFLGRSGAAYVVKTVAHGEIRTLRLRPDGSTRLLHRSQDSDNVRLTRDGSILVAADWREGRGTDVSLIDARAGNRYDHRIFPGDRQVLDADPVHVVLGGWSGPTVIWRLDDMRVTRIAPDHGYVADLAADRLATMTKDPYMGGCTRVSTISAPHRVLWRSCGQRVDSFSPDGAMMATVAKRVDGLGATEVQLRGSHGRQLALLRTDGWFAPTTWEDAATALLPTTGTQFAAVVRCEVAGTSVGCERASDLAPRQDS